MELTDVIVQAPVVGLVIWYVWHTNRANREERAELTRQFVDYLTERNSKMEKAMDRVSNTLDDLHTQQEKHTQVLIKHFTRNQDKENVKEIMK